MSDELPIAEKRAVILERMESAAKRAKRDDEPVLVAVSKVQPDERVAEMLAAGQTVFGENRVQEAQGKWPALKAAHKDIVLHLIGPLQTNKAKEAVALFDVIETLDREKLARALAKEMQSQGKMLPCLVQVNTGEEPQKAGIIPSELPDFLAFCREECALDIRGLMCIPPIDEPPALHFAFLAKLAKAKGISCLIE